MGDIKGFLKHDRAQKEVQSPKERVTHFDDFTKPWDEKDYQNQASRCMDCGIPFCHEGCPLGNKIPDFNDAVYRGEWKEAWAVLKETNNFPEFTGRICPAPCEASCVLGLNNAAVNIEHIEKEISERAFLEGWEKPVEVEEERTEQMAIIGSGPAGLAAAEELRKQGFQVTVFERDRQAGGLLRYGIPDFKLDKHVVERRVELLRKSGIVFELGVEIGKDILAEQLEEQYDSIVICTGSTVPRDLDIPGRSLKGVEFAMDFLKNQNQLIAKEIDSQSESYDASDKSIFVIGGGDTGADCVGTSNRQLARSVSQIELMEKPATARSIENPWPEWPMTLRNSTSHEEGAERDWSVLTKRFVGNASGQLTHIETVKIRWTDKHAFKFEEIEGSEELHPCDLAFLAIGFTKPESSLPVMFNLDLDDRGNIKTTGFRTSKSQIYAAGDCRRGQSLVVWAIAEGRRAAKAVEKAYTTDLQPQV